MTDASIYKYANGNREDALDQISRTLLLRWVAWCAFVAVSVIGWAVTCWFMFELVDRL